MRRSVKKSAGGGTRPAKNARTKDRVNGRAHDSLALARYYDLDVSTEVDDIAMFLALASGSDEPILELACGTGRICVPLAAAGHHVTGVDIDTDMLGRAESAWREQHEAAGKGTLDLVEADMTALNLGHEFGLVLICLNSLLLLPDRAAQEAALRVMAAHLAPGGRAVIDVWLPTPEDLELYDGRLLLDWVRVDDATGEWVAKSTAASYSPATAEAKIDTFFDSWVNGDEIHRIHRSDTIRFVTAAELVTMAEAAGLQPQIIAGDHALTEFGPDSERIVLICRGGRTDRSNPRRLL
jgi:SAM-dependent methyltransferase